MSDPGENQPKNPDAPLKKEDQKSNPQADWSPAPGQPKNPGEGPSEASKHRQPGFFYWYVAALFLAILLSNRLGSPPQGFTTVDFSEFKEMVHNGDVARVQISEEAYLGFPPCFDSLETAGQKSEAQIFRAVPVADPGFIPLLDSLNVEYYAQPMAGKALSGLLGWLLPVLIFLGLWFFLFRRMSGMGSGVLSLGKSKAQLVADGEAGTHFEDVAGVDEAKEELQEVVDFLKKPKKYQAIGGKVPKGILLVGPPGTGKTMLAKAVAGEAKVPFFRLSGADFVEMIVGVGSARVRDLFKQAREKAPCIVFIDELDAIGKSRSNFMGGHDEREQTLNSLLVEMDGFDSRTGVIILAATNRPEILDPALMRPGRFDRHVLVDRPDLDGREAILKRHAQGVLLDPNVNLRMVAQKTSGFVGADLANLINESALLAVRIGRERVTQPDLDEAIEKVMAGLKKKNRLINPKEKEIVAFHETGHAIVAALTPGADQISKISIIPRGLGALGYTMQLPTEDRYLMTKTELLGKIDVLLGGRAAEQLTFGEISTGASNDLVRATEIARKMISEYGMSEKFHNVVLHTRGQAGVPASQKEGDFSREYAESTQQYIDEQIADIMRSRYQGVVDMLKVKVDALHRIARRLLETEILDEQEFMRMLVERG